MYRGKQNGSRGPIEAEKKDSWTLSIIRRWKGKRLGSEWGDTASVALNMKNQLSVLEFKLCSAHFESWRNGDEVLVLCFRNNTGVAERVHVCWGSNTGRSPLH